MKLVIEETVNNLVEIEKLETIIRIADFDVGLRQMLEAEQSRTLVAIEDVTLTDDDVVIQFIDPGGADRDIFLPTPGINNHGFIILNIADNEEYLNIYTGTTKLGEIEPYSGIGWFVSNGLEWVNAGGSSESGGGGDTYQMLTNRSGDAVTAGDVLIIEPDFDKSVKTTTIANDLRVLGVAHAPINNNTEGRVDTVSGMVVDVNCTSATVNRGEYLVASATAGKAQSGGYFKTPSAFAVALTAKSAGSNGVVEAMLIQNIGQAVGGGFGFMYGGNNGSVISTGQAFTIPSETWAVEASAALPAVRQHIGGCVYRENSGFSCGGTTGTSSSGRAESYKMPFATRTTAAQVSANLAAATSRSGSHGNSPTKGYMCGGHNTAGDELNVNYILTFASDITAAGPTLSSGRSLQRGQSDGTYIYISGDTTTNCNRITVSTNTPASHTDANLPSSQFGYQSISFPVAGFMSFLNGATSVSRKLPFSTGVSSNHSSSLINDQYRGGSVVDGIAVGYISGSASGARTGSHKFTLSTEVYAVNSGSELAAGTQDANNLSQGAY